MVPPSRGRGFGTEAAPVGRGDHIASRRAAERRLASLDRSNGARLLNNHTISPHNPQAFPVRAGGCGACGGVPQTGGNSLHAPRQPGYVRRSVSTLPQKGSHPCAGVRGWRLEAPCEPGADPEFDEHCVSPCSTAAPPNPSTCSVPLSWMYDPRRATARTRVPAPASRPVPPGAAPGGAASASSNGASVQNGEAGRSADSVRGNTKLTKPAPSPCSPPL